MHPSKKDVLITIALVVYNQSKLLPQVTKGITDILRKTYKYFEILIIDNGSDDDTRASIRALLVHNRRIRGLVLSRHLDTEAGYMSVLDNCVGDFVIIMDASSDPPTVIPTLIQKAQTGYDIVKTRKILPPGSVKHLSLTQRCYTALYKKILRYDAQSDTSDFLLMSRRVVNSLTLYKNTHRHLHYLNSVIGFPQCTLAYQPVKKKGRMNQTQPVIYNLHKFIDIIISNSTFPLRFASLVGMTASFLSLLYLLYICVVAIIKQKIAEGWLTTSILNASMFLLLFIILTILTEYIDRLIQETKGQPMYIIAEEISSGDTFAQKKQINVT